MGNSWNPLREELFYYKLCILHFQATYDPSHGYNPQPIDISAMALSRELQVSIFLFHSTDRLCILVIPDVKWFSCPPYAVYG